MNAFDSIVGDPGFALGARPGLRSQLGLCAPLTLRGRPWPDLQFDHRDIVCHRPEPTVPPADEDDDDEDDDDRGSGGGNIDPDDDEGSYDDDDDEDETLWTSGSRKAVTSDGNR